MGCCIQSVRRLLAAKIINSAECLPAVKHARRTRVIIVFIVIIIKSLSVVTEADTVYGLWKQTRVRASDLYRPWRHLVKRHFHAALLAIVSRKEMKKICSYAS
jgi:hypothetical protein